MLAEGARPQTNCPAVELHYDDAEQLDEKRTDTNQDCRHDEIVYYIEEIPERAERDRDFDGRMDLWIFRRDLKITIFRFSSLIPSCVADSR